MAHVLSITEKEFDEVVLEADKPVLVDFWASWCPPCKMMEPTIKSLADDLGDSVLVCKINTDQNKGVAVRYSVFGVPTFIVFNKRKVSEARVGAQSKEQLLAFVKENIT